MWRKIPPSWVIVISSWIFHIAAFIQFNLIFSRLELPQKWFCQFIILLSLSLILSTLQIFTQSKSQNYILLILRMCIILLISYPIHSYLYVTLTLLLILILEITLYTELYTNLLFSSSLILALLFIFNSKVTVWNKIPSHPPISDQISLILYSILTLIIALILKHYFFQLKNKHQIIERQNLTIDQLISANIGFQNYAKTIGEQSVIEERNRITRDIHDTIGHTLTNIIMMMESAYDLAANCSEELKHLIESTRDHAKEGLNETRYSLRLLRSLELKEYGLEAIYKLIKYFEKATGVNVFLESGNIPWALGEQLDQIIFRIVQEGLTNAFRHGKATKVWIHFWKDEKAIYINIQDNGLGCEKVIEGIGLLGMKERIAKLGGTLTAHNVTNGFKLFVIIPYLNREENKIDKNSPC